MLNERKLTKAELNKREDIIKDMKKNKRALVKKYGKDAESVMYGRATNIAKKQAESMNQDKLREMIKDSLQNPKKADLNKDGKLSDYEKKRGAAIEKSMKKQDLKEFGSSDMNALLSSMHINLGYPKEFPGLSRIMDAAEDATDFYMDDFEEYSTDRDELVMSNARAYARRQFPEFMAMAAKMMEPIDEKKSVVTENKQEAFDELQMIMDQLYELSDQAKMIFRNNFPGEYRRLDAYGALDFGTSSNRYDVTLEGALENLDMEDDDEDMMQEDLDLGHQDNEPHMLKGDLYRIGKYAMELYQMMDDFEGKGEVDLPHWWQSKISNAKSAIVGAKHYLDFELKEPQIDAIVDVAAEEDVIDENVTQKHIEDIEASGNIDIAYKKAMELLKSMIAKNENIKEGTWSIGTSKDIKSVMDALDQAMSLKRPQDVVRYLSKLDKFLYNTVGDDIFHDSIDSAKSEAKEGNMDRAQNNLSDAYGRAQFFLEREMDREGLKEEEAGEADMVASDIQKAMNAVKGDEAKTHQLKKARTAMNKGDLEKAKKIANRIAKMLKNK